jgi:hypothetical protein
MVTPTVKGSVLNAAKGLQQNTVNTAKGGGTTGGVVMDKNVTGPNFKTTNNPGGNTSIRFGDGAQGQTLPIGSNNIKAGTYRQGDEGSIGDTAVKTIDGTTTSGGTIPSTPPTGQLYLRFQLRTVAVGRIGWAGGGAAPFSFNKIDPAGKASVVFVPAVQIQKIVDKSLAPFLQGDINRPYVIGAIYNGTGPVGGNVPFNVGAGTTGSNVSPSTSAGSGLENPLYRIQIHQGSAGGFNWSRD